MSPPAFLPGVLGGLAVSRLLQITPRIAGQNLIPGVLFLRRAEGTLVRAYSALWVCGPGAGPGLLPRAPQCPPHSSFLFFFHCPLPHLQIYFLFLPLFSLPFSPPSPSCPKLMLLHPFFSTQPAFPHS